MRFTVFTPAYNRAYCLERLYQSLKRQSFRDFEWIIIDDGSTDNTEEVVNGFLRENNFFPIRYRKVQNGGKHRAFNIAVQMAEGELFTCVDSDDFLTDDALEISDRIERSIPTEEKEKYAGVCGLRGYPDLKAIGNSILESDVADMTYLQRIRKKLLGDRSEVIYTEIWKRFPFEEFEGESFLTEATSLFKMSDCGLMLRFFNHIIKITEYLPDGLTANSASRFQSSPRGWGLYIYQTIKHGLLSGLGKWEVLTKYFYCCRDRLSYAQMGKALHMSTVKLFFGINGMRLVYKIFK